MKHTFLTFIWKGQEGLFEVARTPDKRRQLPLDQAVAAQGMNFFAPLARVRRRGRDEDVASTGNVVWVDIDSRDALVRVEKILDPLGLHPSAIVDSTNKGYWLYYKLDGHIPAHEIELLNKGLAALIGGDRGCWHRSRIARLPGSVHEKSGKTVTVVEMTAVLFDPDALCVFREVAPTQGKGTQPTALAQATLIERRGKVVAFSSFPRLTRAQWRYISERPAQGEGIDRSSFEYSIYMKLILQGWDDDQIIAFADQTRLAKHTEELERRHSYEWIERSLRKAHTHIEENSLNPLYGDMCNESETYRSQLDLRLVLEHVQGQTVKELHAYFAEAEGTPRATFMRHLGRLEDANYIKRTRDGRFKRVSLTEKARRSVHGRYRRAIVLRTVKAMKGGEHAVRLY